MKHSINIYASNFAAYSFVGNQIQLSTQELFEHLKEWTTLTEQKSSVLLFNVWALREDEARQRAKNTEINDWENSIRRCKDNLVHTTALVLDFDAGTTIEHELTNLAQYEVIVYTTWSNTAMHNKFRVILPLTAPATYQELAEKKDNLKLLFPKVDSTCLSGSQGFYLPSCNPSNVHLMLVEHFEGEAFDLSKVPLDDKPIVVQKSSYQPSENSNNAYQRAVIESLITARGVHYSHALELIPLAKSIGMDLGDFHELVAIISDQNSSLRTSAGQRDIVRAWQELSGDRMTAGTRDKLLQGIGAKPIQLKQSRQINALARFLKT